MTSYTLLPTRGSSSTDHVRLDRNLDCPNRAGYVSVNLLTDETFPAKCRSRKCPNCLVVEALGIAKAIAMSAPDWAMLITNPGDCWPEVQHRMNRFREYLARDGLAGQWCYHAEHYPNGGGTAHVHAWRHGPAIPATILNRAASRADVGIVTDHPVHTANGFYYGMKEIIRAELHSSAEVSPAQAAFMELNGNHLVHASRAFWRDHEGHTLSGGTRNAVRTARGTKGKGSRWSVMTTSAAARLGVPTHGHR